MATLDPTLRPSFSIRNLYGVRELNGVRGIAALIVFFAHSLGYIGPDPRWGSVLNGIDALARGFNSWVDVFFVLSGYLITAILIQRRGTPHYFHDFYWRRALRILPLYFVALLAVLVIVPHSGYYVLLSAFFLANFNGFLHIGIDGPFWTLAIEEQFYLLWPTLIHRRSVAQLRRLALILAVTVSVLRVVAALAGHNNFNLTFFRIDGLAMGAWLACYFHQRQPTSSTEQPTPPAPPPHEGRWFALTLAAGAAIALGANLTGLVLRPQYLPRALGITGMVIAYTGMFGLILGHQGRPGPLAIFRSRVLGFFGLISYAFYMTHIYVIMLYDRWRRPLVPGDVSGYVLRFVVAFAATTALSLLSRFLLELPALNLRRLVLPPSTPPAETQLPLSQV